MNAFGLPLSSDFAIISAPDSICLKEIGVRDFDLRPARTDDLARLQFISAQARQRYRLIPELAHIADAPPLAASRFESCRVEVAEERGELQVIGFAAVRLLDGLLYLDNISIAADASGRGMGAALLASAVMHAATLKMPAVSLTTFKNPIWNGPWFRKHGFQPMPASQIGVGLRAVMERQWQTLRPDSRETLWRPLQGLLPDILIPHPLVRFPAQPRCGVAYLCRTTFYLATKIRDRVLL
jgi:N-acetylglutamate synthase-like GNAT family acetyltransferase